MYEPSVVVREAGPGDVEVLSDYLVRFYRFNEEFDPAWSMARDAGEKARKVIESLLASEKDVVLVAEYDGKVVGFVRAEVRENPMLEAKRIGVIVELYVHPQYRRRGIAGTLVREAAEKLAGMGARLVAAEFPAANEVAESFYRKHGFRPFTSIYLREVEG